TKTANWRLDTFQSRETGPLGTVDADGRVSLHRRPARRPAGARFPAGATLPRVDIAYSHAGADAVAIDAFVAAGAKGIVVAANAPGRPTPAQREALVVARRRGVAVV